ncbi:MAG: undecaprenyl-diphosphate phosphatase [candidate division KSB1 bacterium]|nr:undecaprenyl-diphosphate phosphatase [candidate division KSB1 bacterium]MDZ7273816.1 undecaprenyl-diphosphate phosphatase [candidate division KSB1 bacterium]MDZ7285972.1 undecaprenyl-diphosphate phosphatase [candidate division KSB1 bacterium]MDZ7299004.1 undecaprenyl-diphosphate phosphatase [candidate division KSB1 bacterium]MDZ7309207.1 undecaprenyl-diphosphate phosphatase [candidate division KSB1 bacterium]
MNEILVAVVLGIVEGLTEFLPVSSTGHLILVGNWLQFTGEKANTFEIFIQLGAIIAVLIYFRDRIWRLVSAIWGKPAPGGGLTTEQARRFAAGVMLAFVPAAILGFFLHDLIEELLFNPKTVAAALIVGGVGIILIEQLHLRVKVETMEEITRAQALGIGLAQCLSLIPGMSRSASTIMGGLVLGLSHAAAAEFSFFLAIPTIFAATLYSLAKRFTLLTADDAVIFAVGFLVSLLVAWWVIAAFMAFIKKHSFEAFGWYRIVLGFVILGMLLWQS